jgi:hypothetical protein
MHADLLKGFVVKRFWRLFKQVLIYYGTSARHMNYGLRTVITSSKSGVRSNKPDTNLMPIIFSFSFLGWKSLTILYTQVTP